MKLKKIKFNNHAMFGDLEVDFQDKYGQVLNTTVLIGENGAGKTTLLKRIYELMNLDNACKTKDKLYLVMNEDETVEFEKDYNLNGISLQGKITLYNIDEIYNIEYKENRSLDSGNSKIIYMPTEINFNELNRVDRSFKYEYSFKNEVNQNLVSDLPSAIANAINAEVFKNEDLPPKKSIKKVCDDINSIFDCMDVGVKFIGLSKDEDTKPLFKDSTGNEFDVSKLSSGEKQLFLRALSLKFLNANNSIILIDEPEISLHPEWQRKIIKVYEGIGENNQLIIATHSPHVVGDIKSEQLRVIKRDENGVSIVDNDKLEETYGHTVESILVNTMKLTNTRNDEITNLLNEIRSLLKKDLYESDEFKSSFSKAKEYLGTLDQDIVLINMEIKKRQLKKGKDNAKDK